MKGFAGATCGSETFLRTWHWRLRGFVNGPMPTKLPPRKRSGWLCCQSVATPSLVRFNFRLKLWLLNVPWVQIVCRSIIIAEGSEFSGPFGARTSTNCFLSGRAWGKICKTRCLFQTDVKIQEHLNIRHLAIHPPSNFHYKMLRGWVSIKLFFYFPTYTFLQCRFSIL